MVSKLKVALDRHHDVDREAMRLKKAQHKQQKKGNVKNGANKKPRLDLHGPKNKVLTGSKKGNNPDKVPVKAIEENEDLSEDEKEQGEFEDVDSDGEAEDDPDEDVELPIIDTSKLEDDLSTDSESDEEEDIVRKEPQKKNEMKRVIEEEEEEEEEEDIPFSDLPTDSDSEDEDDKAADVIPHQKLTVNNVKALKHSLSTIALPILSFTFNDHMTVTSEEPTTVDDANNDLTRELAFYNQALAAATKGRSALLKEKVSFSRPEDYFAEMVKSDSHMEKLARHHSSERSAISKGNSKNSSKGKNKKRK
ncbi:eukaryotic rRNA processing protein EBP2-domain-containing protein [Lipomyces chichibuensis]|uniref:eukaryotic rRNA processing protein EBP2-domain-containing protein n=1 Tax=Lipomyces chichibuensis TaxID=1546026 RepID=UPI0033432FED